MTRKCPKCGKWCYSEDFSFTCSSCGEKWKEGPGVEYVLQHIVYI